MNVKDYISQRLQTFGVAMSEAELLDVCLSAGIDGGDEVASCLLMSEADTPRLLNAFRLHLPFSHLSGWMV